MIIPIMYMRARLAVLSCCVWVMVNAAEVVPGATVSPAIVALAATQATFENLSGDFRWLTGTVDGSGEVREKIGTFAVQRGVAGAANKYNIKMSDADFSDMHRWCSDGVDRWEIEQIIIDEPPTKRLLKPGAQDLDLDRVVACVLLDLPRLTRDFTITLETAANGVRSLVFMPLGQLKEQLARIVVILDGDDPKEVIVDDARNTRLRLVMLSLLKNQKMNETIFRPAPKN